jgi:cation:H+ antiporter
LFGAIAQAGIALALLYLGGELLVRGAATLATRLGLSPLAIGLTVVAFGTSAPELVVSVDAALSGAQDISVGNVVGSNIANIALVLGIAGLLRPTVVQAKVVRIDLPLMVAVSFGLVGVLADGVASRLEGGLLVGGLAAYLAFTLWEARRAAAPVQAEFARTTPSSPRSAGASGLVATAGLALLVVGARVLVTSAIDLATLIGVGEAAVGLTIVAVGTSLPELTTALVATLRGHGDIAVGNAVGSNIFNVLGILGLTAMLHPLEPTGVTRFDLGVMAGLACVLSVVLFVRPRLGRLEGGLLVAFFVLYTVTLLGT